MPIKPRRLSLFADNCGAQNKNNYVLWYLLYKTLIMKKYDEIILNFLIQGHTKFSCDRGFGFARNQLKKTDDVETLKDVIKIILDSSKNARVESLRDLENNSTRIKIFDWKSFLEQYCKKSKPDQRVFTSQYYKFTIHSPDIEMRRYFGSETEKVKLFKKNVLTSDSTVNNALMINELREIPLYPLDST